MKKILLLSTIFLSALSSFSQLQLNIGTGKTADKNAALTFGIKYALNFDSLSKTRENFIAGKKSIFVFSPEVKIETGTADAFSSVIGKLTGVYMPFKMKEFDSIMVPDLDRPFNAFPVSVGVETPNTFTAINAIAEVGWVPWLTNSNSAVLRSLQLGVFLQGGYKFKGDTIFMKPTGGNVDQSLEKINSALFRAKGSFSIDTKKLIEVDGFTMGLVGNADAWYDFVNGKVYHKIEGIARIYLNTGQYIDAIYANGSGAPNFNQGDSYGARLVINF